jgi:hypothetical protein
VEQFHRTAAAEAVRADPGHLDPHRREGVCRQGEEDGALDPCPEVRQPVQAGVLPLPVDGQAVDREALGVERPGEGLDVGGPGRELVGSAANLAWGQ